MKQNTRSLLIAFLLLINAAIAQKQASQWYFSNNSALDFLPGSPVSLPTSGMNQYEGSSSIADPNGLLLFYSNGQEVYNANHVTMPNGTGLLGNQSTNQAALIVPKPNSNNIYYVFTNDMSNLYYSEVDMTLQGGLGDVTGTKNIYLQGNISEKLAGVKHANGVDVWVYVHGAGNSMFYAFLVTPTGVVTTPITSNVPPADAGSIGQMQISPNGKHIAFSSYGGSTNCAFFDLDPATGLVSNGVGVPFSLQIYGCTFSPNSRYLYHQSNPPPCNTYQLDLDAGTPAQILASSTLVGVGNTVNSGQMQIGIDKKIYIARDGFAFLDVIMYPDSPAAATGYTSNGVSLGGKTCGLGLPNFLSSYFNDNVRIVNRCFGDTTFFAIEDTSTLAVASWNFDDPSSGPANIAYTFNTWHIFTAPGTYNVELIRVYNNAFVDTDYIAVTIDSVPSVNLGNDSTLCIGQVLTLNAGAGNASYLWQNGATTQTYTATVNGMYFVSVSNAAGCANADTILVSFTPCTTPIAALSSSDTIWCEKDCIDFFDLSQNSPTSWKWYFQGASPSTSTDQNPQSICYNNYGKFDVSLVACSNLGCDSIFFNDFIVEHQKSAPSTISLINDTLWAVPAFGYQWYLNNNIIANATSQWYLPTTDGNYYVVIIDSNGCSVSSLTFGFYTSMQGSLSSEGYVVFPNPANQHITISSAGEGFTYSIIDMLGKTVLQGSTTSTSTQVNIASLPSSNYVLSILSNKKFVKIPFAITR